MPAQDPARLTFEEALSALEQTVRALEEGNQTLEEAIALFEQGMRLARLCNERLDAAELRLRELGLDPDSHTEGEAAW